MVIYQVCSAYLLVMHWLCIGHVFLCVDSLLASGLVLGMCWSCLLVMHVFGVCYLLVMCWLGMGYVLFMHGLVIECVLVIHWLRIGKNSLCNCYVLVMYYVFVFLLFSLCYLMLFVSVTYGLLLVMYWLCVGYLSAMYLLFIGLYMLCSGQLLGIG